MIHSNVLVTAVESFRSKLNCISYLSPEYCKNFRGNFINSLLRQGITSTSCSRAKDEKNTVENTHKSIKMAYSSYETTKGANENDYPIIIMHGLLGSKSNWNSLCKSIHNKTKRKVIAVDARNHGESPHTAEHTYNHLAADLITLMKDLNIPKATLLGHSMGGRGVMMVALKNPELVKDLIVVDISPLRVSPELKNMLKFFEAMKLVKVEPKVPLSKARKTADSQLSKYVTDVGLRQFLITNLTEGEDGKYRWRFNMDSITSNFETNIATFPVMKSVYTGTTLFIVGGSSDYVLKEEEENIKKLFPKAKFAYVSGAGHWVHADKPEEFLKLVTSFLSDPGV